MKNLKTLLSVLLLAVFAVSCSSSSSGDNATHHVKYQINGLDNSVIEIKYNNASGTFDDLDNITQFAATGDSKTIGISTTPFDAKLEVTANNTTQATKHYVLVIYVDDVAKSGYNLNVPANATTTGQTEFTVPAD